MSYIEQLGKNAQKASKTLISLGSVEKNNLLRQVAAALVEQAKMILAENARDLAAAKENSISDIMLDRLRLNHERIKGIAEGVGQVADLQDPNWAGCSRLYQSGQFEDCSKTRAFGRGRHDF